MTRLFLSLIVLTGCGTPAPGVTFITELPFKAKVGSQDFACGQTFQLGTPATQYKPRDLRLYVHDVTLTTAGGVDERFVLETNAFQRNGLALLDFENKAGDCANGTEETHTVLKGSVIDKTFATVSFTLGVPFEENHQDAAAAAAPLNSTAMFWNWNGGYKFLKADGLTTGLPNGHNMHLGSTGCVAGSTPNSVASCANANRVRVTLPFDAKKKIVLDLAKLFEGVNLDTNVAMTAPGCMSTATDTDCALIFQHLGLPFGAAAAQPQTFFTVE